MCISNCCSERKAILLCKRRVPLGDLLSNQGVDGDEESITCPRWARIGTRCRPLTASPCGSGIGLQLEVAAE